MDLTRSDCWYKDVCSIYGDTCMNHCLRYEEMSYLMSNSGIPKAKQMPVTLNLNSTDIDYNSFLELSSIKNDIVNFVNDGCSMYLCSNYTGNGKTSWAIKLMLKYFNDIWAGNGFRVRGVFVHVPTLLIQLKDFNNPLSKEYRDNLLNADLVIWDDIASTDMSKYDYSQLLMYIDQRCLNDKSNIFTGNIVGYDNLQDALGAKLASRIVTKKTKVIEFKGGDRR